jgi:hypothetical protein
MRPDEMSTTARRCTRTEHCRRLYPSTIGLSHVAAYAIVEQSCMPPALDKLDTMASAPAQPTERLNERYALYGEIASGGMATVHFGRLLGPVGFSRTVAIKRLHQQFASEPEFVKMFVDEALLAARVRHPNVVATVDVVTTEGQLYLVMDYVQGEPLRRLWKNVQE